MTRLVPLPLTEVSETRHDSTSSVPSPVSYGKSGNQSSFRRHSSTIGNSHALGFILPAVSPVRSEVTPVQARSPTWIRRASFDSRRSSSSSIVERLDSEGISSPVSLRLATVEESHQSVHSRNNLSAHHNAFLQGSEEIPVNAADTSCEDDALGTDIEVEIEGGAQANAVSRNVSWAPQLSFSPAAEVQSDAASSSMSSLVASGGQSLEIPLQSLPSMRRNSLAEGEKERQGTSLHWKRGQVLGVGSFGVVTLGMVVATGELIAVKEVDMRAIPMEDREAEIPRLMREIDLLKALHHPNIVTYKGMDVERDFMFLYTEYVPGGSIAQLLRQFGAFDEDTVRGFVRQILEGMSYWHGKHVVHRDIKGANILVTDKGQVKVADLGSATMREGPQVQERPGFMPVGTVNWMAPEVASGIVSSTNAIESDIWSLGCTVIEMLTARPPWSEVDLDTPLAVLFHIATSGDIPAFPSGVSEGCTDFLWQCIQRDPQQRPQACELLRHPWLKKPDSGSPKTPKEHSRTSPPPSAPVIVPVESEKLVGHEGVSGFKSSFTASIQSFTSDEEEFDVGAQLISYLRGLATNTLQESPFSVERELMRPRSAPLRGSGARSFGSGPGVRRLARNSVIGSFEIPSRATCKPRRGSTPVDLPDANQQLHATESAPANIDVRIPMLMETSPAPEQARRPSGAGSAHTADQLRAVAALLNTCTRQLTEDASGERSTAVAAALQAAGQVIMNTALWIRDSTSSNTDEGNVNSAASPTLPLPPLLERGGALSPSLLSGIFGLEGGSLSSTSSMDMSHINGLCLFTNTPLATVPSPSLSAHTVSSQSQHPHGTSSSSLTFSGHDFVNYARLNRHSPADLGSNEVVHIIGHDIVNNNNNSGNMAVSDSNISPLSTPSGGDAYSGTITPPLSETVSGPTSSPELRPVRRGSALYRVHAPMLHTNSSGNAVVNAVVDAVAPRPSNQPRFAEASQSQSQCQSQTQMVGNPTTNHSANTVNQPPRRSHTSRPVVPLHTVQTPGHAQPPHQLAPPLVSPVPSPRIPGTSRGSLLAPVAPPSRRNSGIGSVEGHPHSLPPPPCIGSIVPLSREVTTPITTPAPRRPTLPVRRNYSSDAMEELLHLLPESHPVGDAHSHTTLLLPVARLPLTSPRTEDPSKTPINAREPVRGGPQGSRQRLPKLSTLHPVMATASLDVRQLPG